MAGPDLRPVTKEQLVVSQMSPSPSLRPNPNLYRGEIAKMALSEAFLICVNPFQINNITTTDKKEEEKEKEQLRLSEMSRGQTNSQFLLSTWNHLIEF